MIKYIFWDFNGTILDDRLICWELLNELLVSEGEQPIPYKRYFEVFGFPIEDYYKKAGIKFKNRTYEQMADWFILKYQPLSLQQSLYNNVEETLKKLKEMEVINICLSASNEDNLIEQLRHFKIDHYFKHILGTNNVMALGKKDVAKKFIRYNNINNKDCLLIGDTIEDFNLAKELGFMPVLFVNGHQSKERLSTTNSILVNNVGQIIKIVEKENEK